MKGGLRGILAAGLLAACTSVQTPKVEPDSRIRALVTEPVGDFIADARVASFLSQGCPEVVMTQELFNALVITREAGRAPGTRFDPRAAEQAAAIATAARFRDLSTRYGRTTLRRSACEVVAAETEAGTPATAFLSRVVRPAA